MSHQAHTWWDHGNGTRQCVWCGLLQAHPSYIRLQPKVDQHLTTRTITNFSGDVKLIIDIDYEGNPIGVEVL